MQIQIQSSKISDSYKDDYEYCFFFSKDEAHCTCLQSYTAPNVALLTVMLIIMKDLSLLMFAKLLERMVSYSRKEVSLQ
jgi:hypothetical protein